MSATLIELARKPRALEITGHKHAKFQNHIREGLLPPPVKISERCSAWPIHELVAVNRAIVAGRSSDEIKRLVAHLVDARRLSENVREVNTVGADTEPVTPPRGE